MGLLHARLAKYDLPQKMIEKGVYPYFREIESKQGTEVEMEGHKVLMFGSNAYTGLTGDERVIEAGVKALRQYGSGCAGSRFLNGTLDIHVQLEKELAAFVGKDEALCFSTGFTVNSGVIPQLLTRDDFIICDDRDHASIVDGRRLSFAKGQGAALQAQRHEGPGALPPPLPQELREAHRRGRRLLDGRRPVQAPGDRRTQAQV